MRIGIVTTWFERGAAYVSRQYQNTLAQTHDVFVYARGGEAYSIGDPSWDGPQVTWARKVPSAIPTIIDLHDFEIWILEKNIEIIFFNEQWWWPAIIKAKKLGITVGAYVDYYTEQTVPFFALYDFLICNTKKHLSAFSWHPRAIYVPWGTDINLFKPAITARSDPRVLTFFHSGGISPKRKGCDLVIRAFYALKGNCRLVIHSQKDLRMTFPELSDMIDELQSQKRLECHEKTVPAPGLFHLGDIYVYPTRLEGIGLTILEAAASGLPVIVTDYSPMNEFVRHGENGRLISVERFVSRSDGYYWPQAFASMNSLIDQMQWYIDNAHKLPQLKAKAREVAEQNFDWKNTENQVKAIFSATHRPDIVVLRKLEDDLFEFELGQQRQHRLDAISELKGKLETNFPIFYGFASSAHAYLRSLIQILKKINR